MFDVSAARDLVVSMGMAFLDRQEASSTLDR